MRIISGGQTGVDRAALDVAIARSLPWGGWCPKGGWAEDFATPPGLLVAYPRLRETPQPHPQQRTEWNVRDSQALLILTEGAGVTVSPGTQRAQACARRLGKPALLLDLGDPAPAASARAATWLRAQQQRFGKDLALCIGGPRESETPGIYRRACTFLAGLLDRREAA
jgi:Circularly permutated YpsA SLOG family